MQREGSGKVMAIDGAAWPAADESPMTRRAMDQVSGYVSASFDGRILACNPAFIRIFGFDSQERAKEVDFWSLFPQPDLKEKLTARLADRGRVENLEIRGVRQDAAVTHLLMTVIASAAAPNVIAGSAAPNVIAGSAAPNVIAGSAAPNVAATADRDGEPARLEAQILDVSEKRKLEEQIRRAQRMEAMGQLACGVAHDFNNLLTAILGNTELLQAAISSSSPHQARLEEVRKAGVKAASLTRQLLTFGKGKVVEIGVIQLNEVVEDVESLLAQMAGHNIELVLDLAAGLAPVEIDRSQLEQVILNLAINARDAMDGKGRLTIATSNHEVTRPFVLHHDRVQPGSYTMLAVRDTGCGIEPKIMEHLFEPFFTTKGPGKGTGLGLSTVYGIVKQTHGFISVYNEPTGGVTFKVSFPSSRAAISARPAAAPAGRTAPVWATRTILVAEDDDAVRALLENALAASGYELLLASDGQEALEIAHAYQGTIDLLLTDVWMPRLGGIALASRFSAARPTVPILLISGTAAADSAVVDTTARVEFLEKPFTPSTLLERLRAML